MPSPVRRADEIEAVINGLAFTAARQVYELIITLVARHRIPAIYPYRFMAAAGGLLSYGTDNSDLFRTTPDYIDRVLKGAKPAELPVQLPIKFEFIINLKTAQALGIDISLKLRSFADEVID
jgi:putative ABC transport system substrate-binding protein